MKNKFFGFALLFVLLDQHGVRADSMAQTLPFAQDWSNAGLITTDDNWSGVPGFVAYRGDGLTLVNDVSPATVLVDGAGTPVDVIANQTNPSTQTAGGVAEFAIANPTVALQGSSTADAPFLLLNLNTIGQQHITVSYTLRDVDGSTDNSVQAVALQYRIGSSGDFINVPAAFVADASSGPSAATLVTPITITLPEALNHQPLVQIRWMTANATGNDEWIGIDDIALTGDPYTPPPNRYSIAKHVVAGGGGTSTGVVYSVSGTIGQPEASETMASDRYSAAGGFWAFPTAVQVSGAPSLSIVPASPGNVTISWTPNTPGFVLQETAVLAPSDWTNSPSGSANPITLPTTFTARFYRLSKP